MGPSCVLGGSTGPPRPALAPRARWCAARLVRPCALSRFARAGVRARARLRVAVGGQIFVAGLCVRRQFADAEDTLVHGLQASPNVRGLASEEKRARRLRARASRVRSGGPDYEGRVLRSSKVPLLRGEISNLARHRGGGCTCSCGGRRCGLSASSRHPSAAAASSREPNVDVEC